MNIENFYKGKTLFITGTTGFVGKVLLEKILRSLSEIKRVYIMVRAKKGVTPMQRLVEIFSSELFTTLFQKNPEMKEGWKTKVAPIVGDLTIKKLGISPEDKAIIIEEVDIIINSATSTNFDDPLLEALNINYFGCLRMLDLAL